MEGFSTQFLLVTLVSIFTIVNPAGATLIFLSHAENLSKDKSNAIARRASLTCCLVLIAFGFVGEKAFHLIGITIPAFQIAGGVMVFISAQAMLRGMNVRSRTLPEEQREAMIKEDISIIPLAIPVLSGPGAITTVIVLMNRAANPVQTAVVVAAIMLTSVATYIILSHSALLLRLIGPSGVRVMTRIMGMILVAISVQFIINGLKAVIPELMH